MLAIKSSIFQNFQCNCGVLFNFDNFIEAVIYQILILFSSAMNFNGVYMERHIGFLSKNILNEKK